MGRRRFDHLYVEASVAVGRRLPRYELWLALHERGADPEALSRRDAVAFCREALAGFARERGCELRPRAARRLERELSRFDPAHPTPYERFGRFA